MFFSPDGSGSWISVTSGPTQPAQAHARRRPRPCRNLPLWLPDEQAPRARRACHEPSVRSPQSAATLLLNPSKDTIRSANACLILEFAMAMPTTSSASPCQAPSPAGLPISPGARATILSFSRRLRRPHGAIISAPTGRTLFRPSFDSPNV